MTPATRQLWPPEPSTPGTVTSSVTHLLAPNASSWTYEGTNSYVVVNGSASLLIDPGVVDVSHLDALRTAGETQGRSVAAIVLTHDHPDHSDGARELAEATGAPIVCMSPRFADQHLADGAVLDVDGLAVEVIHTPGHSDDSVCLWIPEEQTMLVGDTVLGSRSAGVMGSLTDLLATLERLREFAGQHEVLALPGHGEQFNDVAASITRVLEVRRRRIDEVRGYLADGDDTLMALIARLYPKLTGSRAMFGATTVISTVEHLARLAPEDGIADEDCRGRILADIAEWTRRSAAEARRRADSAH